MTNKAEQLIVNGVIAVLGGLAIAIKAIDAANAWVRHKKVEKL